MTLEALTFGFVVLGVFVSVAALVVAIVSVIDGRKQLRGQAEQLRLAKEQADKEPNLVVSDARLVDVTQIDETYRLVRKVEGERAEDARRREAYDAEMRKLQNMSPLERTIREREIQTEFSGRGDPFQYEGPLPDKVLVLDLTNQAPATAYEVVGSVFVDTAGRLEPLPYFAAGEESSVSTQGGTHRIEVGEHKAVMVTPWSVHHMVFPVRVLSHGRTEVMYDLSSSTGRPATGSVDVEV